MTDSRFDLRVPTSTRTLCQWMLQTEPDGGEWWATDCGEGHQFMHDGPALNGYRYCPYCGGRLVVRQEEP